MIDCELPRIDRVLCLGAHADDIEIGCAGLVRKLLSADKPPQVHWNVFSASPERKDEALKSAENWTEGKARFAAHSYRDGFFPAQFEQLKMCFRSLKEDIRPDLVLTHYGHDAHQDHRLVSELCWQEFRESTILEYEIPKFDADLGQPNFFVPLPVDTAEAKIAHLVSHFASQHTRPWYREDVFRGLLALRGVEASAPTGFAEAFHARKLRWS